MFDNSRNVLRIALTVLAGCVVAIVILGRGSRTENVFGPGGAPEFLAVIAGLCLLVTLKAASEVIEEHRNRDKSEKEVAGELKTLKAQVARAQWFVVLASLSVATLFLTSVPAIIRITGDLFALETDQKIVLFNLFFLPLLGLIILTPLVSSLHRSVLKWGLGLVIVPLGTLILGGTLVYLGRRELRERAGVNAEQAVQPDRA
jgi:hypothetical protein